MQTFGPGYGPGPRGVAGRRTVIGVSDRGRGSNLDTTAVAAGTGARPRLVGHGHAPAPVHGVFVPGGMFNFPGTERTDGSPVQPGDDSRHDVDVAAASDRRGLRDAATFWRQRIPMQAQIIENARDTGIPVLGVCGGSRHLAQHVLRGGDGEGGGATYLLPDTERGRHNHDYNAPFRVAHSVDVDPNSGLGRIMRGEHWRDAGQPLLTHPRRLPGVPRDAPPVAPHGVDPALYGPPEPPPPGGARLRVQTNSMHWAAARFDDRQGRIEIAAHETLPLAPAGGGGGGAGGAGAGGGGGPGVIEGWQRRDHPFFVGDQGHPEFAQFPVGHFGPGGPGAADSVRHRRVMAALGQAATENLALHVLRSNRPFMEGFAAARTRWQASAATRGAASAAGGGGAVGAAGPATPPPRGGGGDGEA